MASEFSGKILTVLGPVDPCDVGVTLTHEHLLITYDTALAKPEYVPDCLSNLKLTMENLGKIRHYPFSVRDNLVLDNADEIIEELKLYKQAGGRTVCDVTSIGIRTKVGLLQRISRESGVQVITGTGFYIDEFMSDEVKRMSIREMADVMVREIVEGVEGSGGVRCGVIGEVGCSWPLTESERKSLEAAAIAQRETGAPLIIHPGRDERSPFEIMDILERAGADISHTVMSHFDRTFVDNQRLLEFAKRGCYLEYDLFGIECSHYQKNLEVDMPSDAQRIQKVKLLVEAGYTERILLSQDIHMKHRLVRYGGHGYAHILENIVPKMADRGISRDTAMEILTTNPKNWLTFK